MKIRLSVLVLSLAGMVFCSCVGPKGDKGDPGVDGVTQIDNVVIHVTQDMWQYSDLSNNNYFVATVDMPEINQSVFNGGMVKMYRIFNYNKTNATQAELPYSNHVEEYVNDQWVFYNEKVDYEYGVGVIYIFYQVSDFNYEIDETFVPAAMDFRCIVMR